MKVIHVSDCFLPSMGGIETQVFGLASKQAELGWDVTVLNCQPRLDFADDQLPFRVRRSVWPNPFQVPIDPRAPKRFLKEIQWTNPDIVHVHMGEATPVVQALLPHLANANIPTVVTVHSVWNPHITVPMIRAYAKLTGIQKSGVLWTGVSQLVANRISKSVGNQNVEILPNGVESAKWRVEPREHQGLVAVTAGRFAPRKRIPELLRILKEVNETSTRPFRAFLAGEGPGFDSAQRFIEENALTEVIELPGRLNADELRDLYSACDVYLSPSVAEAASIAAAEAQSAGLALLARAQSGLGERISPLEGATASTDQEFTKILSNWVDDTSLVEPIKKHNLTTLCPLDWSKVLPRAERIYQQAITRSCG